jgi:hypothetical protein
MVKVFKTLFACLWNSMLQPRRMRAQHTIYLKMNENAARACATTERESHGWANHGGVLIQSVRRSCTESKIWLTKGFLYWVVVLIEWWFSLSDGSHWVTVLIPNLAYLSRVRVGIQSAETWWEDHHIFVSLKFRNVAGSWCWIWIFWILLTSRNVPELVGVDLACR